MDYIGSKCQVCDEYFHVGDDIVVCPECGTPHHRDCYKKLGHCVNEDKHSQDFDYLNELKTETTIENENYNRDTDLIVCKKCGAKNPNNALFCSRCGESFINQSTVNQNHQQDNKGNEQPFSPFSSSSGSPNVILFDPLAGVKPDTDLGDGVTAAEAAKYVKQNTPYFITIFNNIKNYSKSRFNFCAALFGGGYLLYRKMYKIGTIITVIEALVMIVSTYLAHFITTDPAFSQIATALSQYDMMLYLEKLSALSSLETFVYFSYSILGFVSLGISITVGFLANRMYFNHCKKEIVKIKKSVEKPEDFNDVVKSKGGVNIGLALSLWISYIIISYLPRVFY